MKNQDALKDKLYVMHKEILKTALHFAEQLVDVSNDERMLAMHYSLIGALSVMIVKGTINPDYALQKTVLELTDMVKNGRDHIENCPNCSGACLH